MCRIILRLIMTQAPKLIQTSFKILKYNLGFLKKHKRLWKSLEGALLWEVKHINFIWRLIKSIYSILVVKVFICHILIKKNWLFCRVVVVGGCNYVLPTFLLRCGTQYWKQDFACSLEFPIDWEVTLQEFVHLDTVCSFLSNALLIINFHLVTHSNLQMFFRRTFT